MAETYARGGEIHESGFDLSAAPVSKSPENLSAFLLALNSSLSGLGTLAFIYSRARVALGRRVRLRRPLCSFKVGRIWQLPPPPEQQSVGRK